MKLAQITVGTLAVIATLAVLLIVGLGEQGRMMEKTRDVEARSIENGAAIYATYCTGCHGPRGEGIPGVAPALNSNYFFTQRLKDLGYTGSLRHFVESTIASGRPAGSGQYSARMPTWAQQYGGPLRPDQIRDVTSFILNWEATALAGPTPTPAATATPLPEGATAEERGLAVFNARGCNGCHTIEGVSTGLVGPNLTHIATVAETRVAGQSAEEYIRTSIVNPNAFVVAECPAGPCPAGIMPQTYGTDLTQQELDSLVAYLLSLK